MKDPQSRPVRWWPLVTILVLWAIALALTWWTGDATGQERVTKTLAATLLAILLGVLWLLALSRLPWRRRLLTFLGVAAGLFVLSQGLEFRGVSGDLMPILEWRWGGGGVARGGDEALDGQLTDYPQFLGPGRNATVPGPSLSRSWEVPPRELWRRPVGEGWSAFAIAGGVAVTQEQRENDEIVSAWELESGERLWEHADPGRYATGIGGVGPRATPTIFDGVVYTVGATGRVNALTLAEGRLLWTVDLEAEYGRATPEWGRSGSPLVYDDLVVVAAGGRGGTMAAFDRATGEPRWKGGSGGVSYSSPQLLELAGRRQVVTFNRTAVIGQDPLTGAELWSFPWPVTQPNVAMPVPVGTDRLLVSSGYGTGSKLLRLSPAGSQFEVAALWESPRLKAKFTNVVLHAGSIYGLDDGVLVCLDPETGERRWKRGRYGHGQMILVGNLLLVTTEKGEVVLVEPNPEELRELGRFTAFDGKTWNPPALAGRYLLVRSHEEAALYELPLADEGA